MNAREAARTNTGVLWAGGAEVAVERADVVAFGKLADYGSSVTRYLLRHADGRILFVRAADCSAEDAKWLRRIAKRVTHRTWPDRMIAQVTAWIDLCASCREPAAAGHSDRVPHCAACWTDAALSGGAS